MSETKVFEFDVRFSVVLGEDEDTRYQIRRVLACYKKPDDTPLDEIAFLVLHNGLEVAQSMGDMKNAFVEEIVPVSGPE